VRRFVMKRYTLCVCTALLTFIVGVACAFLWFLDHRPGVQKADTHLAVEPFTSKPEAAELSICQLEANPQEYEGKVVRVRAVYSFGKHGATLEDKNCSSAKAGTWVSVPPAIEDELTRATEAAYGMKNVSGGPLDVLAWGRFVRNNPSHLSDAWEDRLLFKFELMRIEKAARVY
jgi:hypothetical protein